MNSLHLRKGSQLPKLPEDGKLRLYSMKLCPFAQRAHLVLEAKKIPYHTIYVNMRTKPEWFFQISPLGKVPALEIPAVKGDPLVESLIIADYLDDQYPQERLRSNDPLQRARDKIFVEQFRDFMQKSFFLLFMPDYVSTVINETRNNLDIYEKDLKNRGSKFFSGSKPGYVDYMIWPWCERTDAYTLILDGKEEIMDEVRYSRLLEWKNSMEQDPAVKATIVSGENHFQFFQSYFNNKKKNFEQILSSKI